jgi:hypothetical protein
MSEFLRGIPMQKVIRGHEEMIGDLMKYIDLTRDVADYGISWRGYVVGDVGLSLTPETNGLVTVEGANFRIRDEDAMDYINRTTVEPDTEEMTLLEHGITADQAPPVCAEMAVSILAADEKHSFIGMMIAASNIEEDPKNITGIDTPTLPPCKNCTKILDKSDQTGRSTLYMSLGLETDELQIRNMRILKKLHALGVPDDTPVIVPKTVLANKALKIFRQNIDAHTFQPRQYPSRAIASLSKAAIQSAAYQLDLVK